MPESVSTPAPTPNDLPKPNPEPNQPAKGTDPIAALQSVLSEMNLTPEQITERLYMSRKWEDRAREKQPFIEELKEKAKRLDELEEAQKTELQKAADRAAAAEAKAAEVEARAMRAEIAAAKGVPASLLSGTTQEELEASADALLAFRGQQGKPDFGAGNRGDDAAGKAKQLSKDDVSRLYAERKYDEIEKARLEGRLADVLGG